MTEYSPVWPHGPLQAAFPDVFFVVGTNSVVAAINKIDGKVAWVRELPEFRDGNKENRIVWTGPLLASDRVVIASSEGDVIALSPANGETVSDIKVGQPIYIEPIAANGRIYVLTDQAQLIAIK